jgi:hypothetical protein
MSRVNRHPCGCRSNDREFVFLCAPCQAEHDERHRQASSDYRAQEAARLPAPAAEVRP